MKLDTKQQVLLAVYIEYQKDLPKMEHINNTDLDLDIDVFNSAVDKLQNEGYITGVYTLNADNDRYYAVSCKNVKLTRDGLEYVEKNLGIAKELTAADKLTYIIKKCGVLALPALKTLAVEAIKHIGDIY